MTESDVLSDGPTLLARLRPFGAAYGSAYTIAFLNALGGVVVARLLGPSTRGDLAFVQQALNTIASVADIGLGMVGVLLVSRIGVRNSWNCLGSSTYYLGFLAVGASVAFLSMQSRVAPSPILISTAVLGSVVVPQTKVIVGLLRGQSRIVAISGLALVVPTVYLISLSAYGFIWGGIGLSAVVACQAVASFIALLIARHLLRSAGGQRSTLRVDVSQLRHGLRTLVGSLAPLDYMQVDLMVAATLLHRADAGRYAVLIAVASLVRLQAVAASTVMLSRYAGGRTSPYASRAVVILALLSAAVMFPVALWLLPIVYGNAFTSPPLTIAFVLSASAVSVIKIQAADRLRAISLGTLVSVSEGLLLCAFVGAALLAPRDMFGVACALLTVQSVGLMYYRWHLRGIS